MRRTLTLLSALALASACAPRPGPRVELAPVPTTADVLLAGGPEGESPIPTAGSNADAHRPAPTTAADPSTRMALAIDRLRQKDLMIPVAGVDRSRIEDTFAASRDGGERRHNALDILAPRNTPILAADDGTILRLSSNTLGGITIYAADRDHEFVYYYAHLERYRKGLAAGQSISKGDTLGYVGTSGNAPENIPHLHFQVMLWATDGKYWYGEPVNPYPVLGPGAGGGTRRLRFD